MCQEKQIQTNLNEILEKAVEKLRNHELEAAYPLIIRALEIDHEGAQPHNLLGIWYQCTGDWVRARRHFRAAYALDPTQRAACANLEQICLMKEDRELAYDYGELEQVAAEVKKGGRG